MVQARPVPKNGAVPAPTPCVIESASVVIRAAKVVVGQEEEPADPDLVRRYRQNAALLAGVSALLVVWFWLHLQTWATQGLIFGSATLWAFWQLIVSKAKKDFAADGEKLRARLLGREDARGLLLLGCVAAVVLIALTTSVYIKLDDRDTARLRVDLIDQATGKPFMDSIVVVPSSRVGGRLLFPRLKSSTVNAVVVEPAGYEYVRNPIVLKPWSGVDLTFGDATQFRKKAFHAIRIVPGWTFNGMDAPPRNVYDMTIRIGSDEYLVKDVRFQTVYSGVADEGSLKKIADGQKSSTEFEIQLQDYLNHHPDAEDAKSYLTDWRTSPRVQTAPRDFSAGEQVSAGIALRGTKPMLSQPIKLGPSDEITTIFVENSK